MTKPSSEYLKERNDVEVDLRMQKIKSEKEREERSNKDEAAKRQKEIIKMVTQQNQMMMNSV